MVTVTLKAMCQHICSLHKRELEISNTLKNYDFVLPLQTYLKMKQTGYEFLTAACPPQLLHICIL